jgi:type I restriction enzyme S subunit
MVSPKIEAKYERTRLSGGEVLLSVVGTLGECAVVPQSLVGWNVAGAVAVIPIKSDFDPNWIANCLRSREIQRLIQMWATTTVQATLNLRDVRRLPILSPPRGEIERIMDIIGSLGDEIELTQRINETLETMARAIFKAWFVDFVPVKAKVGGAVGFRGMPQRIFDQLPDRLVETVLGLVPAGWETSAISDAAEYVNGMAFTRHENGKGRMIIRIAELNSGPGSSTKYSDIYAEPQYTAFPGDILFAWSGSLGVHRWHRDEALVNQHIFRVIPIDRPQWYVYYRLVEAMPFFRAIAATKATTMGHIKRSHLGDATFVEPPASYIEAADKHIRPLFDLVHINERQSLRLVTLRDTLAPALLDGEIRFSRNSDA